ncbi:uncharacterized protein LOC119675805 [Teleopsis dalmanni]|uniref:uncharacterized protein LOC119675805 n=1 Tax=Teleopsis dalmanni TaxID=139649 RepID=UPI0018CDC0D1|nr:uncharacterized protein LOC119675805 [Teleopsis dalmanni]
MAYIVSNTHSFNPSLCRTCQQSTNISSLHSLEEEIENSLSLGDMLLEIAQINIKTDCYKHLPKYVCSDCRDKLKNAHTFAVQAQKVNKQFIEYLGSQYIKQEPAIEIDSVDIESEVLNESDYVDININSSTYEKYIGKRNLEKLSSVKSVEESFLNVNNATDEFILPIRRNEIASFTVGSTKVPVTHIPLDRNKHTSCLEIKKKDSRTNRLKKKLLPKIESLEKMIDTQATTISEMKMNFESLFKYYNIKEIQKNNFDTNNISVYSFKVIDSSQELRELEENLNDSKYKDWLITHLSSVCGVDGMLDGKNCANELVDYMFSKELLTKYSLLDECREKYNSITNCGIKTYKNVYGLFFTVIQKADMTFSFQKQDEFFDVILKNKKA